MAARRPVKLVMTMLVRDEADVLDAQLAFHLGQGVDFVIATDHRSTDGTTEILERFAREGYVHVIRRDEEVFRQAEWVTGMARLAATEFGADWVINADADEFWWPRVGPLKEILSAVPRRFGVVRGFQRHFAPRADEDGHFAERMIVRVGTRAPTARRGDPFQGAMAVIHRADPSVSLIHGSHDLTGGGLLAVRGWYPFEVLHFPLRTLEQSRRKFAHKADAVRREPTAVGLHTVNAGHALDEDRYETWYAPYVVDDAALTPGVADGSLVLDTRLRDELRRLARVDELLVTAPPRFAPPGEVASPAVPPGSLEDEALYADEMQVYDELDSQLKSLHRIEELERRVGELERTRRAIGSRVRALRSARRRS